MAFLIQNLPCFLTGLPGLYVLASGETAGFNTIVYGILHLAVVTVVIYFETVYDV